MKSYKYLENCILFNGIGKKDIKFLTKYLRIQECDFPAGTTVLKGTDFPNKITIIIYGKCQLNRQTADKQIPVQIFGKSDILSTELACSQKSFSELALVATQYSKVIFLNINKIDAPGDCNQSLGIFLKNLLILNSRKIIALEERLEHLAQPNTGDKLMSYLNMQAAKAGSNSFTIPLDRQQLADYLCVERSAMSAQLSKLRKQGLLEFKKNNFIIKYENG